MDAGSKKISLLISGITAVSFSRILFALLKDPEGPNLPIVVATSLLVYGVSSSAFFLFPAKSFSRAKRLGSAIVAQIALVAALYLLFV
jgi:hypothetical protein